MPSDLLVADDAVSLVDDYLDAFRAVVEMVARHAQVGSRKRHAH